MDSSRTVSIKFFLQEKSRRNVTMDMPHLPWPLFLMLSLLGPYLYLQPRDSLESSFLLCRKQTLSNLDGKVSGPRGIGSRNSRTRVEVGEGLRLEEVGVFLSGKLNYPMEWDRKDMAGLRSKKIGAKLPLAVSIYRFFFLWETLCVIETPRSVYSSSPLALTLSISPWRENKSCAALAALIRARNCNFIVIGRGVLSVATSMLSEGSTKIERAREWDMRTRSRLFTSSFSFSLFLFLPALVSFRLFFGATETRVLTKHFSSIKNRKKFIQPSSSPSVEKPFLSLALSLALILLTSGMNCWT